MLNFANSICDDAKANEICEKHICSVLKLAVVSYIDMINDEFRDELYINNCDGIFPKGFSGDYLKELETIVSMLDNENEFFDFSSEQRFILMNALKHYYSDWGEITEYTLNIADVVFNKTKPDIAVSNIVTIGSIEDRSYVIAKMTIDARSLSDSEDDVQENLEYLMGRVEDLTQYSSVCFEDEDYEFLGEYTAEELNSSEVAKYAGIEV